jgi:hypothetical protein
MNLTIRIIIKNRKSEDKINILNKLNNSSFPHNLDIKVLRTQILFQ